MNKIRSAFRSQAQNGSGSGSLSVRGSVMLETAMSVAVIFLFIGSLFELSRLYRTKNWMTQVSGQTALIAATTNSGDWKQLPPAIIDTSTANKVRTKMITQMLDPQKKSWASGTQFTRMELLSETITPSYTTTPIPFQSVAVEVEGQIAAVVAKPIFNWFSPSTTLKSTIVMPYLYTGNAVLDDATVNGLALPASGDERDCSGSPGTGAACTSGVCSGVANCIGGTGPDCCWSIFPQGTSNKN